MRLKAGLKLLEALSKGTLTLKGRALMEAPLKREELLTCLGERPLSIVVQRLLSITDLSPPPLERTTLCEGDELVLKESPPRLKLTLLEALSQELIKLVETTTQLRSLPDDELCGDARS